MNYHKAMISTFSREFTFAEVRWLAEAFGLANLPFTLPVASLSEIEAAHKSLLVRGVIKPGKPSGWQVDPIAALSIQWIAGSQQFWVFTQFLPDGQTLETSLFLQDGAVLLVLPLANGEQFVTCENIKTALVAWKEAVNLPLTNETGNLPEWNVPQPVTVIRSNWKNPSLAKTMAPLDFLVWASALDWAGEWALMVGGKRLARFDLGVCGDLVWAGHYIPGRPGEFLLRNYSQAELCEILAEGK